MYVHPILGILDWRCMGTLWAEALTRRERGRDAHVWGVHTPPCGEETSLLCRVRTLSCHIYWKHCVFLQLRDGIFMCLYTRREFCSVCPYTLYVSTAHSIAQVYLAVLASRKSASSAFVFGCTHDISGVCTPSSQDCTYAICRCASLCQMLK